MFKVKNSELEIVSQKVNWNFKFMLIACLDFDKVIYIIQFRTYKLFELI